MKFLSTGPSLTEETIRKFEREYSLEIPDKYKQFIENNNGGIIDPPAILEIFGQVYHVVKFFGLSAKGLEKYANKYPGFVPVAQALDNTVVYICCAKSSETFGQIFIDDSRCIALSFTELIRDKLAIVEVPNCPIVTLAERGSIDDAMKFQSLGGSLNAQSRNGLSLISECLKSRNLSIFDYCIDAGAKLDGVLHLAVERGQLDFIDRLLDAGADINEMDEFGARPVDYLVNTSTSVGGGRFNRELYLALVERGAERKPTLEEGWWPDPAT